MLTWTKTSENEQHASKNGERFMVRRTEQIRSWIATHNGSALRDASGRVRNFWSVGEAKAACESAACLGK